MSQSSDWNPFNMNALTYVLKRTEVHVRTKKVMAVISNEKPLFSIDNVGSWAAI